MFPERILKKIDRLLDKHIQYQESIDFRDTYAFLWNGSNLKPVKNFAKIDLNDFIGVNYQKEKLIKNTQKFVNHKPANNVLLWGERGTGKSSLIKAMLNLFYNQNLRMIQVLKHDLLSLFELFDIVQQNPDYRFIIFIDDLSFEETEPEFKELKTVLDGGIYQIPENLLFYATSNRKNLIPVKFSDRETDEKSPEETLQEKISLVERFGLRLGFFKMSQNDYLKIVQHYADKYNVNMDREKLFSLALRFALEYGRNGRTAYQFIKSLDY